MNKVWRLLSDNYTYAQNRRNPHAYTAHCLLQELGESIPHAKASSVETMIDSLIKYCKRDNQTHPAVVAHKILLEVAARCTPTFAERKSAIER